MPRPFAAASAHGRAVPTHVGVAVEAEDEGTAALMSDYIREQEKLVWMRSAYLY